MNYIKVNDDKILISCAKTIKRINRKIDNYLEQLLLKDLTTLKGRVDSIKKQYHIYKLTPIYIDEDICLIPLFNQSYNYNYYLNVNNIKNVEEKDERTEITFVDGERIIVNKKRSLILKQINKALSIKRNH